MRYILLTGRLTRDVEFKESTTGGEQNKHYKLLKFSIANNDNGKEKDPEFFDVIAWDNLATWGNEWLKKGKRVIVTGVPHNQRYTKDDVTKTHFQVVAERIEFID